MKHCPYCNNSMEDAALFCSQCGQKWEQPVSSSPEPDEKEKAFYVFRRNLRHERKCWSIFGKVWVGFCIFFAAFSILYLMLSLGLESPVLSIFALEFFLYPVLLLPAAIINLVMANKITGYLNALETDPNPAVERCGAVWLIVLSALFNNIALIFVIMNFIHVKTNKDLLIK